MPWRLAGVELYYPCNLTAGTSSQKTFLRSPTFPGIQMFPWQPLALRTFPYVDPCLLPILNHLFSCVSECL